MPRAVLHLERAALHGTAPAPSTTAPTTAVFHVHERGGVYCARQCDALRLEQYSAHLLAAPTPAPAASLHQLHHQCDLPDVTRWHLVAWALHLELVKWWLMPAPPSFCPHQPAQTFDQTGSGGLWPRREHSGPVERKTGAV